MRLAQTSKIGDKDDRIVFRRQFRSLLTAMGKEQELILAAQTGNLVQIDKILGQRAKKSGPLQRYV
jgi:hypothetical protein